MIKISRKDIAYNYLYDGIINNKLKPGQSLKENEIALSLSISRTPVREALKELEKDGLVKTFECRSSIVSKLSPNDISDIFDVRIALEKLALEKSIKRISDEEIDSLIHAFIKISKNFKWEDSYLVDKKLHDLIVKRSANKKIYYILKNLNSQIERFRTMASKADKRSEKSINEHLDLLSCLKSRDLNKSQKSLEFHLNSVKNSLFEIAIIDSTNF